MEAALKEKSIHLSFLKSFIMAGHMPYDMDLKAYTGRGRQVDTDAPYLSHGNYFHLRNLRFVADHILIHAIFQGWVTELRVICPYCKWPNT